MSVEIVKYGSEKWRAARALRHASFFLEHDLPESVMNDNYEKLSEHVVVLIGGELRAYGRLTKLSEREYLISQMVVNPNHQAKGLGSIILESMLNTVGNNLVSLNARLPATGFYMKFGFKMVGKEYLSESTGVQHIKMVRKNA